MRVVTKDGGAGRDDLQPTRHLGYRAQSASYCVGRLSQRIRYRSGSEAVFDVDLADQRQRHVRGAARSNQSPLAALGCVTDVAGADVGVGTHGESDDARYWIKRRPLRCICVQHSGATTFQIIEQARFRLQIRVHCSVIVEVIPREIGKDRGVELDSVDSLLIKTVRRDFHRHCLDAAIDQLA